MSKQLSSQDRRVLEELVRRRERVRRIDFSKILFGPQKAFVEDPAQFKVAVCSRRAGKTYGLVLYMLREALKYSYCQIPFITLTRAQGKRNIWLDLQQLNDELNLGAQFNNNELTCTLPNGSVIFICGANDETEIQRLRGGKYPLAVIDEAQSFRPFIRGLVTKILEPAVADYRGTICMTGTPGPAAAGYYYEMSTGKGDGAGKWSIHHWTVTDNPHHPYDAADLERVRKENGWLPDNPTFLREWLGQWVHDDSLMVYKLSEANIVYELPGGEYNYTLGIDLGFGDSTAFVVLAWNENTGLVYIVESRKETGLIPSAVAARVQRYMERFPFTEIIADSGGFGKGYVEEMKQRYAINVQAAQKQQKYAYIELLNGDLQSTSLRIIKQRNQDLIDEMALLQWEEGADGLADRTRIDERFDDHLCDATLYAWRACRQYLYDPLENDAKPGSKEWAQQQETAMLEETRNAVLGDPNQAWWESGFEDAVEDESLVPWGPDEWL